MSEKRVEGKQRRPMEEIYPRIYRYDPGFFLQNWLSGDRRCPTHEGVEVAMIDFSGGPVSQIYCCFPDGGGLHVILTTASGGHATDEQVLNALRGKPWVAEMAGVELPPRGK